MRKFIINSMTLGWIVLLTLACIEYFVRQIPNSYKYKNDWMLSHGAYVKTLILGNSHNYFGLNPLWMGDSVFNAANVSQTFDRDLFLLDHFISHCPHLKTVILNVDYSNLFDLPLEQTEKYRCAYYHIYMQYPIPFTNIKDRFEVIHSTALREKLYKALKGECKSYNTLGWCTEYNGSNDDSITESSIADRVKNLRCRDYENYCRNVDLLVKIASLCKRDKINLVIVSTPLYPKYAYQTGCYEKSLLELAIRRLLQTMPHANYYNFSVDRELNLTHFHDCDHLNARGAFVFSRQLSAVIK